MYEPKKDFYSDMVKSIYSETVQAELDTFYAAQEKFKQLTQTEAAKSLYGVAQAEFEGYYTQLKHAQEALVQADENMQADLEAFYVELKKTSEMDDISWEDLKTSLEVQHTPTTITYHKDVHSDHGDYIVKPDSSVEPYKFPKGESWAYKQNYDNHPGSYGSIVPYDKSVTNEDDFADPYTWPTFKPKPAYDTPLAEGPHHAFENILGNLVPGLNEFKIECPSEDQGMCGMADWMQPQKMRLTQVVMHLNDLHNWTREEIADWLETLDIDLTIRTVESNDISEGGEQS